MVIMELMLRPSFFTALVFIGLSACNPAGKTGGPMTVEKVVVGQLGVNCYIVSDAKSRDAIVIDPGDEPERIIEVIDKAGLAPRIIIFTHGHYDHICAARELRDRYKARIMMHGDDAGTYQSSRDICISWGFQPDDFPGDYQTYSNGETITAGSLTLKVIHTPGHTPGSSCLLGDGTLFSGDTLFRGTVGRTDLPGGNTEQLISSLEKLKVLPQDTRVLCGHGDETTIGRETKNNPYLNGKFKLRIF